MSLGRHPSAQGLTRAQRKRPGSPNEGSDCPKAVMETHCQYCGRITSLTATWLSPSATLQPAPGKDVAVGSRHSVSALLSDPRGKGPSLTPWAGGGHRNGVCRQPCGPRPRGAVWGTSTCIAHRRGEATRKHRGTFSTDRARPLRPGGAEAVRSPRGGAVAIPD